MKNILRLLISMLEMIIKSLDKNEIKKTAEEEAKSQKSKTIKKAKKDAPLLIENCTRLVNEIILHCSASSWGCAKVIKDWHVKDNGWSDIGYHYVVNNGRMNYTDTYHQKNDGKIELGRPLSKIGAHCYGHNTYSIGICLIGNDKDAFTANQFNSVKNLVKALLKKYPNIKKINGHNFYEKTRGCPLYNVSQFQELLS